METKKQILRQVIAFLIITTIITFVAFIWIFSLSENDRSQHAIMMFIPGFSAIIASILFKDKIRHYGWGLGKIRFYGYAYLLPILVALIAYGLTWLCGITEFYTDEVVHYKWARIIGFELPVPILIGLLSKGIVGFLFIFVLVTGEEIGWSGFLTRKLLTITSVPVTALTTGLVWAIWHYPAIIGGLYNSYYDVPLWIKLTGFTLVLTSASFIRTVLLSKSKSLWLGTVLHASHNVFLMGMFFDLTVKTGYAGYFVSETGIFTGVIYLTISILFWKNQKK
ncbi:MAG: CPBP family intramembrane metalloprotease [Proteobacteria bacterium]|nr:CPBP family intramembrane metalloprotease [Pseudomonadota bacterium]